MAKNPAPQQQAQRSKTLTYAPARQRPGVPPALPLVLGATFLALSGVMSLLLVMEHLGGLSLPGCGEGSACARATRSFWSKVPGLNWPVSYLGLAYFLAALVAWIAAQAAVPRAFRYLVRLGALASLGFCVVILQESLFCTYCIAAHVGNFAFWITLECTRIRTPRGGLALGSLGTVFVLATAALGAWDWQHRAAVTRKGEQERTAAVQRMIEQAQRPSSAAAPATQPTAAPTQPAVTRPPSVPTTAAAPSTAAVGPSTSAAATPLFTGRYRHGPEQAPIRIVMFTGYQCPDCYDLERQLEQVLAERSDVAVSIKHFVFNPECNPLIKATMHPNGCWAARAAEAAGILWGPAGFWKMHKWLFQHRGLFETQQQLEDGIREIGYDPQGFVETMMGEETMRRVRADCDEGERLGLHFTPMTFINGVELKGWYVPNALLTSVAELAAQNPPPRTAADDHPQLALDKYLADWRQEPVRQLPPDKTAWSLGSPEAPLEIVMWGDYQEPFTALADAAIRTFVAIRGDARYTFRHYPFNSDCNANVSERRHPLACRASQAAEAAGRLAGNDAYWKMHAWLMENQKLFSDDTLREAAAKMGLDPDALLAAMAQSAVRDAIADDVQAGTQLPVLRYGLPPGVHSIPALFVNGRYVPRWLLGETNTLPLIFEEASAQVSKK